MVESNRSGTPVGTPDVVVYASSVEVVVASISGSLGQVVLVDAPTSGSPMTIDFDWSNIPDYVIEQYLAEAHDFINSKLYEKYSLPLASIPPVLKIIEKKLAAGYLLDKEYSAGGDETEDSRGRRWIKWAEDKLKEIAKGELELLDSSGAPISQRTGASISGWPDDTTEDADDDDAGGDVNFRMSKKF